ncbi:hypothetical protein HYDPIDRAFT_96732 [Hydnomerulius pinastri MD-312]|uniref:AB hydrolase-1 domain-containing protein n=1 Tax=Hydnomerulius pinastri MD-312 TaxID=994086 RepID=A0A0C9VTK3_9AGAM|nr:hypothetical protein HYDPIDRAFT_96732 [Hydnomerulius pinastri MD-312]
MSPIPSVVHWGNPTANKRVMLIHGMTSSAETWSVVAQELAAKGYFVVAPNMIGHASRWSQDYRIRAFSKDLLPYFSNGAKYDAIAGHSLGAVVALDLITLLSPATIPNLLLIDPPLDIPPEQTAINRGWIVDEIANKKGIEFYATNNPRWSQENIVGRILALYGCSVDVVDAIIDQNDPFSFKHLLDEIPPSVRVSALLADPAVAACPAELLAPYPQVQVSAVQGSSHWVQSEFPEQVVTAVLQLGEK